MDALLRLVAVRHAQTTLNAARRLSGQRDPPLTDEGRAQAGALAPLVAAPKAYDVVVRSDLARTRETLAAMYAGAGLDVPGDVRVDARWRASRWRPGSSRPTRTPRRRAARATAR
jgi:glucosyl-3-phosphoglycerate phosphatase